VINNEIMPTAVRLTYITIH